MGVFGNINGVFGLGKPYIKLEFDDNEALLDFQKRIQPAGEAEPIELRNGEFYPIEGISEKDFFDVLDNNTEPYIFKDFTEQNKLNVFGTPVLHKDSYGNIKYAFVVKTPLKGYEQNVYIWEDINHALLDNSTKEDRTKFWTMIKPTLERPAIIFEKDGKNHFVKCFQDSKGNKVLFTFIPTLINERNLKTFIVRKEAKKGQLYKKYKDGGSVKFLNSYSTFNGIERRGEPIFVVECRLYCGKDDNNFSDNQNFNKNLHGLGAPGDTYIVTDTRKNPRKNLEDTALFKKYDVENTRIPAKLFQGDESAAIDFALNSNTLSTKETDIERANYYRKKREGGVDESALVDEIKNNEGKNWVRVWAFSHLLKDGFTNSALKAIQNSSNENAEIVKVVAEWIGKIFAKFPFLTAEHDKEIYKYLVNEGAYGKGAGKVNNYQKLLEKITKAIERRTQWGKFDSAARLNLWNLNESTNNLRVYDEKKANLSAELRAAINELNQKRKTFFQRANLDKTITTAQINAALKPYQDNVNLLQRKIIELENNKSQYTEADKRQQALTFDGGFGRTANNALYNNNDIIECRGLKPTYKILSDYDDFFDIADSKTEFAGFGLDDTKKLIADTCRKHYKECAKIAKHLKADSLMQSCFNLWHWLRYNIRYEYDREGREEIRTPLRVWQDRVRGVDCDCLSVFSWCVLKCMGYNPVFELVAFKNRPQFSHIFINCDGVLVDRVWFIFNSLPPGVTKCELYEVKMLDNLGKLF